MALKNFKALKDFERDGVSVKSGEELVLTEREGEKRMAAGEVMDGRFLDPADPKDAKAIEKAEAEYDEKYEANMAKEAARDEAKQEELAQDDEKREELVEEGEQLIRDLAEADGRDPKQEEIEQLQRLETDVLEKRVVKLRAEKKAIEDGDKPAEGSEDSEEGSEESADGPSEEAPATPVKGGKKK